MLDGNSVLAAEVQSVLAEHLNGLAPLEEPLRENFGRPITYRGSIQGYNLLVHTFTFDADPPFDVVAFENDHGEILQVLWNADGDLQLTPGDPR